LSATRTGQQQSEYRIGELYGPPCTLRDLRLQTGAAIAWAAEKGNKMTVFVDGKEGQCRPHTRRLDNLQPKRKTRRYLARADDRQFVVLDGFWP